MGPLFSIMLVLAIAAPVMAAIFVAAKFFLPFRFAVLVAVLATIAGAICFAVGVIAQAPFYPRTLDSTAQVVAFLGISCGTGVLAAVLTAWVVWRVVKGATMK